MKLIKGRRPKPLRAILYAEPKVGKTTFAGDAPGAGFACVDDGQDYHDIARIPWDNATPLNPVGTPSWEGMFRMIDALGRRIGDFGAVTLFVVDHLDALERILRRKIAGAGRLEDVGGGFGKGANAMAEEWTKLLRALDTLRIKRPDLGILLLAQAKLGKHRNPGGLEWNRWGLALMERLASDVEQWVDEIYFAEIEMTKAGDQKHAAVLSTGARVLHTAGGPGWKAGNRVGLPSRLPLSWSTFEAKRSAAVRGEVDALLAAEAIEVERMLPAEKRSDARGSLRERAAKEPGLLRRYITWAQGEIEAMQIAAAAAASVADGANEVDGALVGDTDYPAEDSTPAAPPGQPDAAIASADGQESRAQDVAADMFGGPATR